MRRALAVTTLVGGLALAPAFATPALASDVVVAQATDQDEPLEQDGDDDTGKYGLIGLTGLLGLFGYKKYKDHRAARPTTSGPIGDHDGDGSGSRRI